MELLLHFLINSWILCLIPFSSIIIEFLSLSLPKTKFSFRARDVKFTYKALSLELRICATVVFPVHGVPVIRMTCLKFVSSFCLLYYKIWLCKNKFSKIFIAVCYTNCIWVGELVCGFRTSSRGLRKLRPHVELQRL